jgi:hypothetical protein
MEASGFSRVLIPIYKITQKTIIFKLHFQYPHAVENVYVHIHGLILGSGALECTAVKGQVE